MSLTTEAWHKRFLQQAQWTEETRSFLFPQLEIHNAGRILEVGCGTGAITKYLHSQFEADIFGIDIRYDRLQFALDFDAQTRFTQGDALSLPYASQSFDMVVCHFLLMWLPIPIPGIKEMCRVTRRGGIVAALAEPDYGGRIDYPYELEYIGQLQSEALHKQGADINTGRQLGHLLLEAGINNITTGLIGGLWQGPPPDEKLRLEWEILKADLSGVISDEELIILQRKDIEAWQNGIRVMYIPTFYSLGWVE